MYRNKEVHLVAIPAARAAARQRVFVTAFMAAFSLLIALGNWAGAAEFTGLGKLPGGSFFSFARGVSADGSVVVGGGTSASGFEAFRWTSGGGMVGLGDLPGGIFESASRGVSANGSVVVGLGSSASGFEAFRWTSGGGMVGLGDLPGGSFSSRAEAVSADGSVVVGWSEFSSDPFLIEAYRWTSVDGMVGLGDLAGGRFSSRANGVSADGSVVVGGGTSASGFEAFRWTSGGGMVGLGDLPGGSFLSGALGVSADGSVVVGSSNSASGNEEAFRWTSGGGMVGLGDLPGGSFFSRANGVSADGSVVVGQAEAAAGSRAFIWDAVNGMRNLQDVLSGDLGLDLAGFTLTHANAVSPSGRAIAGSGLSANGLEAWRVVVDAEWVSPTGGKWDTFGNWALAIAPASFDNTLITPATGLTVAGPTGATTVKTLTLGAQSGTATLDIPSTGTLT